MKADKKQNNKIPIFYKILFVLHKIKKFPIKVLCISIVCSIITTLDN